MSELPKGWADTTFGELFDFKGGSQPPKSTFRDSHAPGYVRLLQIRDFESDAKAVFIKDHSRWPKCSAEDIMIGRYGASVGKILGGKAGAYNVALVRMVFDRDNLDPGWVRSLLLSDYFQKPLGNISRSAQNGFNKADLDPIDVPLPPLPEQRRIVAKIDSLTGKSRRARDHLDHVPRLVEKYKQAVLAAAFRGELTREWRGSALDLPESNEAEELWSVPPGWRWRRVGEIGKVSLGRQRSPANHNGPHMRPYVRAANITWQGWDFSDVKEMNFDEHDYARFQLKAGDVLVNEGSGSAKEVGKPAIWRGAIANCCFQNTLIRVQPQECSSEYLYWYFLLSALAERFVSSTQGVNIYHIGKDGLARFLIPQPPAEEQDEIVRRIETAFAWIDRLASEATSARRLIDRLDQAVLAKAFRGELVPQDPGDEPASVLLDRIRAERGAAPRAKRGRKARAA